jgi:hypothetical protein
MARLLPFLRSILFSTLVAAPVAIFAVLLGHGTDAAPVSVSPVPVAAKPVTGKDLKRGEEPAENLDSMVSEILERPLFSPSRQSADKPDSEDVAQAPPPPPPPQLPARLAGMNIRPETRQALFEVQAGQKLTAVSEGQEINGWTVASIQPDQVVLRSTAGEQVMKPGHLARAAAQVRKPAAPPKRGARPSAQQAQRPGQNRPAR